jgi:hypothetical protein
MTINVNTSRNEYIATSGQTVFNFTFKIYAATDLNVYVTPAGQECNDVTDLTEAYTVTGVGLEDGGSITLNTGAGANDLVTIVSAIPSSRTTDYQSNGDFTPETVNNDIGRAISLIKQVESKADRSLLSSECLQGPKPLTLPNPESGEFIRWKADVSGLENVPVSAIADGVTDYAIAAAAASAAAALVSEGNAATSETNAAASAAAALVSEGNAATSETNAAASAASVDPSSIVSTVSFNNISGLIPSNAADADHDITISAGKAFDSTGTNVLELTSTLTKQIDAAWAAGDNLGGLFSGTVAADTTYHLFIIEKDSDGSIDAGFDTSITAANIPVGYTAYRRVASFLTDGLANLLGFSAIETAGGGYRLTYEDIQTDLDTTEQTTGGVSLTLTVPQGLVRLLGHLKATLYSTSSATIVITEITQTNVDPLGVEDLRVNNSFSACNMDRVVNTSAQVRYRSSSGSNSGYFRIYTLGYTDFRR